MSNGLARCWVSTVTDLLDSGNKMERGFAVIGLGYVGLPVAIALARRFQPVFGFDISGPRLEELRRGRDATGEVSRRALQDTSLILSGSAEDLKYASFYIITVPTPIDENRLPDLRSLKAACRSIGSALRPGSVVTFESTVWPGLTREVCGPLLAEISGLRQSVDFNLAYSPERINPGDEEHRLENTVKIVAGEDKETVERVAAVYSAIVPAGVYRAPSIEVAEAAKVIENTQRDLNIALMNELAIIFERLGIPTTDVLAAAGTKWNFLRFTPGLVGGHCIGVDPYYLTNRAERAGYTPHMILAGRRINDGMGTYIARRLIKLLVAADRPVKGARVGILGLSFKENVPDIRNSRVPDIVSELRDFGVDVRVHDPLVNAVAARDEYGLDLADRGAFHSLDGLILAVPHRVFLEPTPAHLSAALSRGGVLIDVKSALRRETVRGDIVCWSL